MIASILRKKVGWALALLALMLAAPVDANAQGKCNNETFKGDYGFTLTGWRIPDPALPQHFARAGVGRLVADGKGNLSGSETKSKNGVIIPVTFSGTYTVYADCTGVGSITMTDPDESIRNYNFVIDDSGGQVRAIQTDQGRAVTVIATRERGK